MPHLIIRFQKCRKDCKCKIDVTAEHGPYVYLRTNSKEQNKNRRNRYHDVYLSHANKLTPSIIEKKIPQLKQSYCLVDVVKQFTRDFPKKALLIRKTFSIRLMDGFFK